MAWVSTNEGTRSARMAVALAVVAGCVCLGLTSARADTMKATTNATPPANTAAPPNTTVAPLATILAAVKAQGARGVLVNVWATWCEPCREELPELLRLYRDHRGQGLRLVMVSADDPDGAVEVSKVLRAAATAAGLGPVDFASFIKTGDDTEFVNGLDTRWSGALPATFLFDGGGRRRHSWRASVTAADLDKPVKDLLTKAPAKPRTTPKAKGPPASDSSPMPNPNRSQP